MPVLKREGVYALNLAPWPSAPVVGDHEPLGNRFSIAVILAQLVVIDVVR